MTPPFSRTIFELLEEQAATAPDHPVIIIGQETVSYACLAKRAGRLAAGLRSRGLARGDRVGLLCDNRVEWLEVFFAVTALGATLVPFSTWSTRSELEFLITDSAISWLFSIGSFGKRTFDVDITALQSAGQAPALRHVIMIDSGDYQSLPAAEALPRRSPAAAADATDIMVTLYTSGSSNRPKSVPLSHFAAIENAFNIGERQGLTANDRVLISIPLFWSYGAVNALPAILSHGATMVLQGHFAAAEALDLIEQHRCTALYTLPAMTNALLQHADFRPERTASLRTGVTIGAPRDLIKAAEELGARQICNIYGATENYGNCCVTPADWPLEKRAQCQGPPLPGVKLRIMDPQTQTQMAVGEIGEIEVSGYLTPGYSGDSAKFNADVFTKDGYFRTGDLGALDETGALHYAGRRSEMIKRAGINVSPAEVEEILLQHSDIALAGVTGLEDEARGEIIVGFICARPGVTIEIDQVLAHCREYLSAYKLPDQLHVVAALPLTVTGKLMRADLKQMAAER